MLRGIVWWPGIWHLTLLAAFGGLGSGTSRCCLGLFTTTPVSIVMHPVKRACAVCHCAQHMLAAQWYIHAGKHGRTKHTDVKFALCMLHWEHWEWCTCSAAWLQATHRGCAFPLDKSFTVLYLTFYDSYFRTNETLSDFDV